jgi:hypothetical protein
MCTRATVTAMAFQCAVTVQAVTAQSMQLQTMAVVTDKAQKLQLICSYKQLLTVSSCAELPVKQVHSSCNCHLCNFHLRDCHCCYTYDTVLPQYTVLHLIYVTTNHLSCKAHEHSVHSVLGTTNVQYAVRISATMNVLHMHMQAALFS